MATAPTQETALRIRRISLAAYQAAVAMARSADDAVPPATPRIWAELTRAGIAQGEALAASWATVIGRAHLAPVQIRLLARQGAASFHTEIALLPGIGLCRTQRAVLRPDAEGLTPAGREEAVELVAFPPEDLWQVVRRVIPPDDVLRAPARPTPPSRQRELTLPEGVAEAFVEGAERDVLGRSLGEILLATPGMDPELAAVLSGGEAEVSLLVSAQDNPHRPTTLGVRRWILVEGNLYVLRVRPDGFGLAAVEPGDIAGDLIFLVTGAYQRVSRMMTEGSGS